MNQDDQDAVHELLGRRWEYDLAKLDIGKLRELLNERGMHGWELCQAEIIEGGAWHCIFKRRIP